MTNWQPIETAPKDGNDIIVFCDDTNEMMVAFWNKKYEGWQFAMGHYDGAHVCSPSHWMPLPEPPEIDNDNT